MITVRFHETWPVRRVEWLLALALVGVGIAFAVEPALELERSFSSILALMPREMWAIWAVGVGAMRLVMLYINGAWHASPAMRAVGAFLACFIWCALMLRAAANPVLIPSAVLWPLFLGFDIHIAYEAARDGRRAFDKRRQTREPTVSADVGRSG